jgi:hypothetical protein
MKITDAKVGQSVLITTPKIRRTHGLQYAQVGIDIIPGVITEVIEKASAKTGWESGLRIQTATGLRFFTTAAFGDKSQVPGVDPQIKIKLN